MEVKKRDRKDYKCRVSFAILPPLCRKSGRAGFLLSSPGFYGNFRNRVFSLGLVAPLQRPSLNRSTVKKDDSA